MVLQHDFINRFAAKGYTKKDAKMIMDDFIQTICEFILSGEEQIRFPNFGSFVVRNKPERPGVKFGTGEKYTVPAYKQVSFKAAPSFKELLKK